MASFKMEEDISNKASVYPSISNIAGSIGLNNTIVKCNCAGTQGQSVFSSMTKEGSRGTSVPQTSYMSTGISNRPMKRKKKISHQYKYLPCYVTNQTLTLSSLTPPTIPYVSSSNIVDMPPADPSVLQVIQNDPTGFINVQGSLKEVRFYGENAIVIMDWDDPRDVNFETCSRRVVVDDRDIVLLTFNRPYINYTFPDGSDSRIRLGAPTRDLYIDGMFIQATFGGLPVQVSLGGFSHKIQLGGPNPKICVGNIKRNDLLLGRVNLIVDENLNNIFHIYLDLKPQRFNINGIPLILRFSETLKRVFINDVPLTIDFGGRPILVNVFGEIHQLRLSPLPKGVIPGLVNISGMKSISYQPVLISPDLTVGNSSLSPNSGTDNNNYHYHYHYHGDSTSEKAILPVRYSSLSSLNMDDRSRQTTIPETNSINVEELYLKLVENGIIQQGKPIETRSGKNSLTVDFSNPETLKLRNMRFVYELYTGAQCSMCSLRFMRRDGEYASHLDWHFQIKRHQPLQTMTQKWWCHTSEFPRSEHNCDQLTWFEKQKRTNKFTLWKKQTVPAKGHGVNPACSVCLENFIQYFNEDEDEWYLKYAIVFNGKLCHPICSQDLKENSTLRNLTPEPEKENPLVHQIITIGDDSEQENPVSDGVCGSKVVTSGHHELDNQLLGNASGIYSFIKDEKKDMTCNKAEQGVVTNISIGEKIANNENAPGSNETVEESDKDEVEIVEVKPKVEIVDLTEYSEGSQTVEPEADQSLKTEMQENRVTLERTSDLSTMSLDGDTQYCSPIFVKINPIKVNILSKKTISKEIVQESEEEDTYYEQNLNPIAVKQKIAEAKMTVEPERFSGRDFSSICSIM